MKRVSYIEIWSQVNWRNTLLQEIVENILFAEKGDFKSVKIADFGLGAKYQTIGIWRLDKHCGTKVYMAP